VRTEFFLNGTLIQNGILSNAALGAHTITYNVADECGNIATGSFNISVVDNVNPIAICDQHTTVGIGSNGYASVPASVFDDGSYDNCGITSISVRRMTDACNTPPDLSFHPYVEFCCEDVGNIIMVEFRIEDAAGNFNSCMVEVELENNTPPAIFCPADKTIDCSVDYTNMNVTGEAVATSDCGNMTPTFTDFVNLSTCGVGTVLRTWSVSDGSNNSVSCVQTITVINSDPFYINPTNDNDPNDDVVWPPTYDTPNCTSSLEPSALPTPYNGPVITASNCGDVAVGHDDLVLPIVNIVLEMH